MENVFFLMKMKKTEIVRDQVKKKRKIWKAMKMMKEKKENY